MSKSKTFSMFKRFRQQLLFKIQARMNVCVLELEVPGRKGWPGSGTEKWNANHPNE
jgi:hypothetical protein